MKKSGFTRTGLRIIAPVFLLAALSAFPVLSYAGNRYWVGGTADWDSAAGSKWALTSGGAGGQAVPTAADNVFFTAASGAVTVTVAASANCANLDFTGFTGTLAGSSPLNIYGSLTMAAGMSRTYRGTITFAATSTGKTITFAGQIMASATIFEGTGGGWTLQDAWKNCSSGITLAAGSLNTNGNTITTTGDFNISGTSSRTLTLGASMVNVGAWTATTTNNLTFNTGASTIKTSLAGTFAGGGLTHNIVILSHTSGITTVTGSSTFGTLTISNPGVTVQFSAGSMQSVTNFNANGTEGNLITLLSTLAGSPFVLSKAAGTVTVSYLSLKDSVAGGGATWFAGETSVNVSGNTGWIFTSLAPPSVVLKRNVAITRNVVLTRSFSFTDQRDVPRSTLIYSDILPVKVAGGSAAVSITGSGSPAYRICNDAVCSSVDHTWSSAPGSIDSGQYLQLQLTSSAAGSTANSATVAAGTLSDNWSVTTETYNIIWRSDYNNAEVKAYVYSGLAAALTWDVQHSVCASNSKATPGTSNSSYWDKACSYSAADNFIVTSACDWGAQAFTQVAGTLPAGTKGYMCAQTGCNPQKKLEGDIMTNNSGAVTINPGDYILCSRWDDTPDAFIFTDLTGADLSTLVYSNILQITGLERSTTTTISGAGSPEYRICNDAACTSVDHTWSAAAGSIDNSQYLQLRLTSGASSLITSSATIAVGAGNSNWSVTTGILSFIAQTGVELLTLIESNVLQITGISNGTSVSISGAGSPEYRICNDADCIAVDHTWSAAAGLLDNNQYLQLRLVSNSAYNTKNTATMTIGADNKTWEVTTINLLFTFSSHTFTNCDKIRETGPTVTACRAAYSTTWDENSSYFDVTSGIQYWTVPRTAVYTIEAWGAGGGGTISQPTKGGKGARMRGEFLLTGGEIIKILVGQKGSTQSYDGAGGGATFVTHSNNTPLIVAGGGGGATQSGSIAGVDANIVSSGTASSASGGAGGSGGSGGTASSNAGSGGGLTGNGQDGSSAGQKGLSFVNGGTGGGSCCSSGFYGGFGGGGGTHGGGWGGGGGGGYSGGGAASTNDGGGGGGSYNIGNNQSNSRSVESGHGHVIISLPGIISFTDQTDVPLNTLTESNILQLTGGTAFPAAVSISGTGSPEYRICNDAACSSVDHTWSNAAGSFDLAQYLQLRLTSNAADLTANFASVTVGTESDNWSVTTLDLTPDSFAFIDQYGVPLSSLILSNILRIAGIAGAAVVSIAGDGSPEYRICNDAACASVDHTWGSTAGSIDNDQYLQLRLTSSGSATPFFSTVTVGGGSDGWMVTPVALNVVWSSDYNGAEVKAYQYTGSPVTLTWAVQHDICAANSRVTPGTSNSGYWNQYCSYSPSDNFIVTANCNWGGQGFTKVTGTLPGGTTGYMCAHSACNYQKKLVADTMTERQDFIATINPGDYVFCSRYDPLPDPFAFTDQAGAALSILIYSNILQITGIDPSTTTTISGNGSPQYQICNDAACSSVDHPWSSSNGIIDANQYLQLRLTSEAWGPVVSSVAVAVGIGSDTWTVTTLDNTPASFSFTDQTEVTPSSLITSDILQITGITTPATVSISGDGSPEYRICNDAACGSVDHTWGSTAGSIDNNQYLQLRLTSRATTEPSYASITVGTMGDSWRVTTGTALFSFSSHTFTNCGQSGATGPLLAACRAAYATNWDEDPAYFNISSGIQYWTVPETGVYRITAYGAGGSSPTYNSSMGPGKGARITGEFLLTNGEVIRILVGQTGGPAHSYNGGSGGGTFITRAPHNTNASILLVAGGGANGCYEVAQNGHASTSTAGGNGVTGLGGTDGQGGTTNGNGTGGGGFFGNGGAATRGGYAYVNGGAGGYGDYGVYGGFGGGGGGGNHGGAGGGGYSGGGGGNANANPSGGGGSYNNGLNPTYTAQASTGPGLVIISTATDTIPNSFSFTDQTGVATNTLITSNILQITGIEVSVAVSTAGDGSPEYRICNDAACSSVDHTWGGVTGSIDNNQYLQLRLTSDAGSLVTSSASVTVGYVSDTWSVTTGIYGFVAQTDVALSALIESNILQITGISNGTSVSISGDGTPGYRICNDAACSAVDHTWSAAAGSLDNNQYLQLRLTSAAGENVKNTATMTIGAGNTTWDVTTLFPLFTFSSHTFTNCAQTGMTGPSVTACRTAYGTTWDENSEYFNVSGGIQSWTVPMTGSYWIEAAGAQGGSQSYAGGSGARKRGAFTLTKGEVIRIAIGQMGTSQASAQAGGGGGTFVVRSSNTPLIIAGGGGGGGDDAVGVSASYTETSSDANTGNASSSGGAGGKSGGTYGGAGGGGFNADGATGFDNGASLAGGGLSWANGLTGGSHAVGSYGTAAYGGFGGGGSASWAPGGGGGYSGGPGRNSAGNSLDHGYGGGGGSYNSGFSLSDLSLNTGHGQVIISTSIDTMPAGFSFTDQTGVATSTLITSNILQITGIDVPATVSISGAGSPEYRICDDAACSAVDHTWSATAGSIDNSQYLQLRQTSSAADTAANSALVNVGDGNDNWSVTTGIYNFTAQTGVAPSTLIESNILQVNGISNGTAVSISGAGSPQYRICNDAACSAVDHTWSAAAGSLDNNQYLQLRLTSNAGSNITNTATMTVGAGNKTWDVTTYLYAFFSHTFTNCGQTGMTGPTVAACRSAYSTAWDENSAYFDVSGGTQTWTVPVTGTYRITAWGAEGAEGTYNNSPSTYLRAGGKGARMRGDLALTAGDVIKILVGQRGARDTINNAYQAGAGGGGTFVVTSANSPLIIAGGGGGGGDGMYGQTVGDDGTTDTSGTQSGGSGGGGGTCTSYCSGGGGLTGNGVGYQPSYIGKSFINGGAGGNGDTSWTTDADGGFGGGGAAALLPGGGGGYSGGGVVGTWSGSGHAGGGGSYNIGTSQANTSGVMAGHGRARIMYVPGGDITSDAFNFTDQSGAALNTVTVSSILQITGLGVDAPVSISGAGSPQFRTCNDSACSSVIQDWGSADQTIANSKYLQLRLTSSGSSFGVNSSVVSVGLTDDDWSVTAGDATPDVFNFTDQTDLELSTPTASNILQIAGLAVDAPVTISGAGTPQFRTCNDAACSSVIVTWGSAAQTIANGKYLQLRSTSSASGSTGVSATVNVGAGSDIWNFTTGDNAPTAFNFTDLLGIAVNTLTASNILQISGLNIVTAVSISGAGAPQFRTCNDSACTSEIVTWGSAAQTIVNNKYLQLRLTSNAVVHSTNSATVTVGTGSDLWNVMTIDTTPDDFYFMYNTAATPSALTESDIVKITGINTAVSVSISGEGTPQYRICNDAACSSVDHTWSGAAGSLDSNQYLQLRLTSKASGVTTAAVSVGTGGDTWMITTDSIWFAFGSHNFTNCGKTGMIGPSLAACRSAYSTVWDENSSYFNVTSSGTQLWLVPKTGVYTIEAWGAGGGGTITQPTKGGKGARIRGEYALTAGERLKILVGQKGSTQTYDGAGGGGTFVTRINNTPLIVAGGGGGATQSGSIAGVDANIVSSGTASSANGGAGGSGGNGGTAASNAGSGGGITGDGQGGSNVLHKGYSFVNGGAGGDGQSYVDFDGGFGGGASTNGGGWGGGGGGGYSGGGAASTSDGGGGGGSYTGGTNQSNSRGVESGHGHVTIRPISTPADFSFTDRYSVALNTLIESNLLPITGEEASYSVSIAGDGSPQYRICNDDACNSVDHAWGSSAGSIDNSQYLQLRLTSSGSIQVSSATVTVGTGSDNWIVSTSFQPGQQAYTTPGSYQWVAPAGVTSVSVVVVGGGGGVNSNGGGGGGALRYGNNIAVVPGNYYTVKVGSSGITNYGGGPSSFNNSVRANGGGAQPSGLGGSGSGGDGGGSGGNGGGGSSGGAGGGGGAGGYSGSGGVGGTSGGGTGGGGGGVGLYGEGASGAGGYGSTQYGTAGTGGGGGGGGGGGTAASNSGYGGSGGGNGYACGSYGCGGAFGGGSGVVNSNAAAGGVGAVRIIWGLGRAFPATNTGDQ